MKIRPIEISGDSIYLINNTKLVKGAELEKYFIAGTSTSAIEILGAISVGFVIGWLLGFTNKFVMKESITVNYFATIVSTLIGATVIGYFSNSSVLLGVYGTSLGVGFLLFSLFYSMAGKDTGYVQKLIYPHFKN